MGFRSQSLDSTAAEMDAALEKAKAEFPKEGTADDVANWWSKWYTQAGHKRLGRYLVEFSGALRFNCSRKE